MFVYIIVKTGDMHEFFDIEKFFDNRKDASNYCKEMNKKSQWYHYEVIKKKIKFAHIGSAKA